MALKIFTAYYNFMVDTAVIYGADRLRAEIELKNSMDFEVALVKVSYIRSYISTEFSRKLEKPPFQLSTKYYFLYLLKFRRLISFVQPF